MRCDKRGIGESEGVLDFTTTLADLASDVEASIDYLKEKPIIDQNQLGLPGHSNGRLVAAKVITDLPDITFIVLLASPGIKQGDIVCQQLSDIPKIFGISDKTSKKLILLAACCEESSIQIIIDSTIIILGSEEDANVKTEMVEQMYERSPNTMSKSVLMAINNWVVNQIGH